MIRQILGGLCIAAAVLAATGPMALTSRRWSYGFIPDPMLRPRTAAEPDRVYDAVLSRLLGAQWELTTRRETVVTTQRVLVRRERVVAALLERLEQMQYYDRDRKDLEALKIALRKAIAAVGAAREEVKSAERSALEASATVASRIAETAAARKQWEASFDQEVGSYGALVQRATLLVMFRDDASDAQVKDVLERNRLEVQSEMPVISLYTVTSLDEPQKTFEAEATRLRALIRSLEESEWVETATQNTLLKGDFLPQANKPLARDWFHMDNVLTRHHHLQAWNFHAAMTQKTVVGVLDVGFETDHSDVVLTPAIDPPKVPCADVGDRHGSLVAGVIGAAFNDGHGTDGGAPYVKMYKCAPLPAFCSTLKPLKDQIACKGVAWDGFIDGLETLLVLGAPVINASIGYGWSGICPKPNACLDPATNEDAKKLIADQGEQVRTLMAKYSSAILVSSAGNDSRQSVKAAKWASPFNWAALGTGTQSENIIVAEAIDLNGSRLPVSNTYASIKALGENVVALVTTDKNNKSSELTCDATSGAAPLVTSTVAMIQSLNSSAPLLPSRIKDCLGIKPLSPAPTLCAFLAVSKCVTDPDKILGDLDNDKDVDEVDFRKFRALYQSVRDGVTPPAGVKFVREDLNGDTEINAKDLKVFVRARSLSTAEAAELERRLEIQD